MCDPLPRPLRPDVLEGILLHWELSRRLKWSDKDIEEVRNALLGQRRIEYEVGSTPDRGRIGQRYRLVQPPG